MSYELQKLLGALLSICNVIFSSYFMQKLLGAPVSICDEIQNS